MNSDKILSRRKFLLGALAITALELTGCASKETKPDATPEINEILAIAEKYPEIVEATQSASTECTNCAVARYARDKDGNILTHNGVKLIDGAFTPPITLGDDKDAKPQVYSVYFEEPVPEDQLQTARLTPHITRASDTEKVLKSLKEISAEKKQLTAQQQEALEQNRVIKVAVQIQKAERTIESITGIKLPSRIPHATP